MDKESAGIPSREKLMQWWEVQLLTWMGAALGSVMSLLTSVNRVSVNLMNTTDWYIKQQKCVLSRFWRLKPEITVPAGLTSGEASSRLADSCLPIASSHGHFFFFFF